MTKSMRKELTSTEERKREILMINEKDIIIVKLEDKEEFERANKRYKDFRYHYQRIHLYFLNYQRYRQRDFNRWTDTVKDAFDPEEWFSRYKGAEGFTEKYKDIILWCVCKDYGTKFPSPEKEEEKERERINTLFRDYKEYVLACVNSEFSDKEARIEKEIENLRQLEMKEIAAALKTQEDSKNGKKMKDQEKAKEARSLPNNLFANFNRFWYDNRENRIFLDEYVNHLRRTFPHRNFNYIVLPALEEAFPPYFTFPTLYIPEGA
jgi:hypothetical protein